MVRQRDHEDRYGGSSSSRRKHHDSPRGSGSGSGSVIGARGYREHSPTQSRRSRSPSRSSRATHHDYDYPSSRNSESSHSHSNRQTYGLSDRRSRPDGDYRNDTYRDERQYSRRSREREYEPRSNAQDSSKKRVLEAGSSRSSQTPEVVKPQAHTDGLHTPSAPLPILPPRPAALPTRPAFLPSIPPPPMESPGVESPISTGSPALVGSPAAVVGITAEDPKARARKDRLEAWKREREAQKAFEEAKLRAQSVAAAHSTAVSTILPSKTIDGPTSISASGLKGFAAARIIPLKGKSGKGSAMDDSDQPAKKQLKKLNLPPMDPLLKPGAGGKVGSGSDLEDGEGQDDDIDDDGQDTSAMQVDKAVAIAEDEDEEDPLDAFMSTVKDEVKHVDDADRMKSGSKTSKIVAPVMADDDGNVVEDTSKPEPDELDQAGTEDIMALAAKKIKKKDIPAVDHTKIEYETFQKDFYHPPTEIEELSEDDADRLRMELDAIKVRGKDCPKPLTKWSYCGLPASCLDVIKKLEYASPTPIQTQAIPAIMSGRDIIGVAKTGSGKTMAFLLPMFRHIKGQRPVEKNEGPIGLIMTPTRELAVQIFRESKPFLKATGLRAVCVYGGAPISEQIAEMKKTADIVVATPGRMIDLLTANSGRVTNLRRITYLVLDEADRMFDMGFEPQVMKIINNIRPDRQTVLFSATFPKQMESLARKVLRNRPLEITVGGRSVVAPEIEQIVEVREEETKFNRLLEILGQTFNLDRETRALVFVDRQKAADELFKQLLSKGYTTMSLHGGQDQVDRDATISDFKAGDVDVVIATSIAARGIDVKQLKLVINYDAPNHMEDYVHRAGRTGRAGNKGTCVTFITPEQDRYARDIIAALKASKVAVPSELQALADSFQEKVTSGKAQVASSGFGGKGLDRLESDREKTLKAQRSAYGEGEEGGVDASKESAAPGVPKELDDIKVQRGPPPADDELTGVRDMHIEVKKGAAPESIRTNKVKAEGEQDRVPPSTADLGASTERANTKVIDAAKAAGANATQLAQALAKINAAHQARLNQRQQEAAEKGRKPKDPDATDYHAIVPINDFPQKARWRCTNKETMSTLIADTGASITNRGIFYEKGKEPQAGEPPKLQLLIESNDESKVEHAVRSIKQILLEATQAALEAEQRNPAPGVGRYNVI